MNEPKTLAEAIGRIKTALQPLDWVDAVFGRAHRHAIHGAGQKDQPYAPYVYVSEGEYRDVRPDDRYKSVVFFYSEDPEKSDFDRAKHSPNHAIRSRRDMVLYGWVNLAKFPAITVGDGFAEEIKLSLKKTLKRVPCVVSIDDYQEGPASIVFRPFTVSDIIDRGIDWHPYLCFRVRLTVMTIENL